MRNLLTRINEFLLDAFDNRQIIKLGRVVVSVDYYAATPAIGLFTYFGRQEFTATLELTVFSLSFSYLRISGTK